jgi:hypothetical protein
VIDRTQPGDCLPKELYIDRTLVRDRRQVVVRALNATSRDRMLKKGSP